METNHIRCTQPANDPFRDFPSRWLLHLANKKLWKAVIYLDKAKAVPDWKLCTTLRVNRFRLPQNANDDHHLYQRRSLCSDSSRMSCKRTRRGHWIYGWNLERKPINPLTVRRESLLAVGLYSPMHNRIPYEWDTTWTAEHHHSLCG